jgi:hypothetical protein
VIIHRFVRYAAYVAAAAVVVVAVYCYSLVIASFDVIDFVEIGMKLDQVKSHLLCSEYLRLKSSDWLSDSEDGYLC